MKRTWTIIGVGDVPGSFKWYQSLFGQPATPPAHDYFGQILDSDGTVLLCLHEWGAHEHPSLMSPDHATPGNGLLLFFRVDDFDMALAEGARARHPARRGAARESEHGNQRVLTPRSGRVLRHDQCAICGLSPRSTQTRLNRCYPAFLELDYDRALLESAHVTRSVQVRRYATARRA